MVNYQNGKIYRIDGSELTYIGSTTNKYLSTRLAKHKSDFKKYLDGEQHYYTSFQVLKTDDCKIELIEKFPCDSKDELSAREGHFIRQMDCVNKQIAGRTPKEWYDENKEQRLEQMKQYYNDNKETIRIQQKQYYEENKEAISARTNQKHTCECGGRYTTASKTKHLKTQKHLNYLKGIKE